MKVKPEIKWTARPAGGLFLGLRYHFAVGLFSDNWSAHFQQRTLSVGFIFFTVTFNIETKHRNLGKP